MKDFNDAGSEPSMMSPLSHKQKQVLPKFVQKQKSLLVDRTTSSQVLNSVFEKQNMASTSVGGLFEKMHQSLSFLHKSVPTNISVNLRTEKTQPKQ